MGLIDLRSSEQFNKRHIKGSTSIPAHRLERSMHELPENKQPIAIIGEADHIKHAYQFLISKNYIVINQFTFSEAIYRSAKEFNLLESGSYSVQLWQANPLLQ